MLRPMIELVNTSVYKRIDVNIDVCVLFCAITNITRLRGDGSY